MRALDTRYRGEIAKRDGIGQGREEKNGNPPRYILLQKLAGRKRSALDLALLAAAAAAAG